MGQQVRLQNFGENLAFEPATYSEPRTEDEVLALLEQHRGQSIRTIGSLHSWSQAPVGTGLVLNLKHLKQVEVLPGSGTNSAVIGAGCQIKRVLTELKKSGQTLPSVGLISEQTMAGATATGTHGSGRHSLSHYIRSVRVACYDRVSGKPILREIGDGPELQAARCSLGCLGVIVSVRIACRPLYSVEEYWQEFATVQEALAAEHDSPLQQFFLVPWRWNFLSQSRREVPLQRSRLAGLYRVYWFLCMDLALHLLLLFAVRIVRAFSFTRFLFRHVIPKAVIRGWKVTDESSRMLVMEHELFRHIETELFVRRTHLPEALEQVREVLETAANSPPRTTHTEAQHPPELEALRGCYGHHYPICIRRVLPDETLISMAADSGEDWYAISMISYQHPSERQGFQNVMTFLAQTFAKRFGGRPHWGKWCPLSAEALVPLYPRWGDFVAVCQSQDPTGQFRNEWLEELFQTVISKS